MSQHSKGRFCGALSFVQKSFKVRTKRERERGRDRVCVSLCEKMDKGGRDIPSRTRSSKGRRGKGGVR